MYQTHPSQQEEDGFKDFAQIQPLHPRYQHLLAIDNFAYRYRYRPNAKDKYDGVQIESPNAELGTLLTALALMRRSRSARCRRC